MDCDADIQSSPDAPSMVSKPWSISHNDGELVIWLYFDALDIVGRR